MVPSLLLEIASRIPSDRIFPDDDGQISGKTNLEGIGHERLCEQLCDRDGIHGLVPQPLTDRLIYRPE